jgi:hypothetical protein
MNSFCSALLLLLVGGGISLMLSAIFNRACK